MHFRKYKTWKVLIFDSVTQGISDIPSYLDFEIIHEKKDLTHEIEIYYLKQILNIIQNKFTNISIIQAKIPIIRVMYGKTNINLDISVGRENGYKDSKIISKIISEHKILKQVIIILKIYTKVNNLNCTQKGGINSFLLFHLVYYFFKEEIKQDDYKKNKNYWFSY